MRVSKMAQTEHPYDVFISYADADRTWGKVTYWTPWRRQG
jgi:hypothetical protein